MMTIEVVDMLRGYRNFSHKLTFFFFVVVVVVNPKSIVYLLYMHVMCM